MDRNTAALIVVMDKTFTIKDNIVYVVHRFADRILIATSCIYTENMDHKFTSEPTFISNE